MVLWSVTLKIGALTKLSLFFPVVCFIYVFEQTLAEQLYHDKGLYEIFFLFRSWRDWRLTEKPLQ